MFHFNNIASVLTSQYGNAVQDDLWDALTKQAKTNNVPLPAGVKQIMDTWTLKMGKLHESFVFYMNLTCFVIEWTILGFPVVMVKRDYQSGTISLSQVIYISV